MPLKSGIETAECGQCAGIPPSAGLRAPTPGTYWRTLRSLRWSQMGYLALRRVLPHPKSPARIKASVNLRFLSGRWRFIDWQPEVSRKMIAAREFTFLNQTVAASGPIPWNDRRHAKLWLYHLNYFDFLNVGFALPAEEPMLKAALEIALDWCARNTKGTEVGWEPYALSVRIINWLKFLARYGCSLECMDCGGRIDTLLVSLGAQAATLERRLEKDLLGNHLLKNIKALLFAGALLETPRSSRWWAKGEALLERELKEQILPDGGHFERSPMYHAQILEDLAELRLLCAATGKSLSCSRLLAEKIQAMAQFMRGILHPDGEIPLFNDSVLGGATALAELLATVELADNKGSGSDSQVTVFPDTGYGVIRSADSRSALIFDCGPLGPDYQPGHAHCDVLSYELSLHGQRIVVDTGVSTYQPGAERSYERSTAAHNTLRIDGQEQAETWSSFRVGRRPHVGQMRGGSNGGFCFLKGEHDAYQHLGVDHARTVLLHPPDTWIVVDVISGTGSHRVESFLHFHPRVRVKELVESPTGSPPRRWTLEFADQVYWLAAYGAGEFDLLKCSYAEQFGNSQSSTALRWAWQGTIPTGMIHVFAPMGDSLPRLAPDWRGNSIEINGQKIPLC